MSDQPKIIAWAVSSMGNPDTDHGTVKTFETEVLAKKRRDELKDSGFTDVEMFPLTKLESSEIVGYQRLTEEKGWVAVNPEDIPHYQ